ncbi:MAG: hypothetical protein LBR23_00730 [Spirochaetaceae bacterium]|jgi:hypothetical protein|nr:hypothetical protein [Spirochaetaceae bacterium]
MNAKKIPLFLLAALTLTGAAFGENNSFSLNAGVNGLCYSLFDVERIQHVTAHATVSGGAGVFFDAKYAEAAVDIVWGSQLSPIYPLDTESGSVSLTHLGFSLYGKYPFGVEKITLYPMAGFDYHLFLSGQVKDFDGNDYGARLSRGDDIDGEHTAGNRFDFFTAGIGLGMDFPLPKGLFIRAEMLLNYKFDSKIESDYRKNAQKWGYDYLSAVFGASGKIGVGYRFFER